jgi:hypothetical protein
LKRAASNPGANVALLRRGSNGRQSIGRPVVLDEPWGKITVMMLDRHAAYLDLVGICIRLEHHTFMSRAEIIRGLLTWIEKSGIDFSDFAAGREITESLTDLFRGLELGQFSNKVAGLLDSMVHRDSGNVIAPLRRRVPRRRAHADERTMEVAETG